MRAVTCAVRYAATTLAPSFEQMASRMAWSAHSHLQ